MNYKYFVFLFTLFLIFLPGNAMADSVYISVDLPIYTKLDMITIYGELSNETILQINIINPADEVVVEDNVMMTSGSFSHNIVLDNYDLGRNGIYVISVTYNEIVIKNEFFYDSGHNVNPTDVSKGIETISESDQIIIFSIACVLIVCVIVFLARGSIFRKKNEYDTGEWESKKNRDYEKYHSEWMSDEISFERKGKNKLSDEDFRKSLLSKNIPDYYAILQIQKTASQNEIKNQFRSLAKKWHPDRKQSDDAEKKMAQINMAYEVLSNTKRRKMYDQHFSKK